MVKKWVNEFHGLALVCDEVGWQSCPYREINSKRDVLLSRVTEWEYWTSLKQSFIRSPGSTVSSRTFLFFKKNHPYVFLLSLLEHSWNLYLESSSMLSSIIYWGMKLEPGKPLLNFQGFVPTSPPQNFLNLFVSVCVSHIFTYTSTDNTYIYFRYYILHLM